MAVNEVVTKLGSFELKLKGDMPREILDGIQYFGHIAVIPGTNINVPQYGDNLLNVARYVGVIRKKTIADSGEGYEEGDELSLEGVGMAFHLGDEDGKGAVYETPQTFVAQGFSSVVTSLLPTSVTAGNISTGVSGTFTGAFQYQTPRDSIQYICDTMSTTAIPVTWRVNGNATLDAGPESGLYVTSPTCIIVRKGLGEDLTMRSLKGSIETELDVEDFTTRVVLLAEQDGGGSISTGAADIPINPYKDIHGNAIKLTRLVSESETTTLNADSRAALELSRYESARGALTLSTEDYDVQGTFKVGDYVYVYDPDAQLYDVNNEIVFRGRRLNPMKLKVYETEWAVTQGYSVGFRDNDGNWTDITRYIDFDTDTNVKVVVGDFTRNLASSGEDIGTRLGSLTAPDTTVPGQTTFVTASFETVTYLDSNGNAKARQKLVWNQPLNTDLTAVTDGDYYQIQYRLDTSEFNDFAQTWTAASTLTWDGAEFWNTPVNPDATPWASVFVGFGDTSAVINELLTGVAYDFQIRLVDTSGNQGAFSSITSVTMSTDNIPPSTPAAPTVAGSTLNIQVSHTLGKASGGTYNLENDLGHLEIHYSLDQNFTPTNTSLVGHLRANASTLAAQVPAIGSFPVLTTDSIWVKVIAVDLSGNKSSPSDPSSVTASLIDSENVSELTASKLSAGTIGADLILGANIQTAAAGARSGMNQNGIFAYNAAGDQTFNVDAATGDVTIVGTFSSGPTGQRVEVAPSDGVSTRGEVRFYSQDGTRYGYITGYSDDIGSPDPFIEINDGDPDFPINMIMGHSAARIAAGPANYSGNNNPAAALTLGAMGTYLANMDNYIAVQANSATVQSTWSALVETSTTFTPSTNWTVSSFNARKTCGIATWSLVITNNTGAPIGGTPPNWTDTNIGTLPAGYWPANNFIVDVDVNSAGFGSAIAFSSDGHIGLRAGDPNIANGTAITITGTYVL